MALPSPRDDQTAVITGASSGIGAEIARVLAGRGHGVMLVARREERLRDLADALASEHGVRTEVHSADLTDPEARAGIIETIDEKGLTASILVNNAGITTVGPVAASDPAGEIAMIRTDVEAVAHLCSLLLPGMVERKAGAILNVASMAAFQPLPGQAGYGGSKAFVLAYTHGLRGELRGTGVTASVVCPGPVETEFAEVAGISEEDSNVLPRIMWVSAADVAREAVDGLASNRAVIVPGTANRVAAAVAYLTPRRVLVPILARQHPGLPG